MQLSNKLKKLHLIMFTILLLKLNINQESILNTDKDKIEVLIIPETINQSYRIYNLVLLLLHQNKVITIIRN
jgi:hypothetical protein